jgi:hypothetical protein
MWIDGADFRFSDDRPKGGAANQHVSFYLPAVRRKGPDGRDGPTGGIVKEAAKCGAPLSVWGLRKCIEDKECAHG